MNIQSQKAILAKLLATEDVFVVHSEIADTASFDLESRALTLPVWKNISPELYDLFVGHEVGHALYTPKEEWLAAINSLGESSGAFKSFLNVIEDARIEKLIKRKFPGIRKSFFSGYSELLDKDFFGINGYDQSKLDSMSIIDRINVHMKTGSLTNINFKPNEKVYVERIENLPTFDETIALAKELYEYSKEEAKTNRDPTDVYIEEIGANTQDNFDAHSKDLVSTDKRKHVYLNLPKADLSKIIVPYKTVQETFDKSSVLSFGVFYEPTMKSLYARMVSRTSRHIQVLVKNFEMYKNAKQYARERISRSGDLDTKRLHSYKMVDDLFKRITTTDKGKSHGLVLYMDMSGSMHNCLAETVEQLLILTGFCQKVGINFEVYGFCSAPSPDNLNHDYSACFEHDKSRYFSFAKHRVTATFHLRELLSSNMSPNEYKRAASMLLLVSNYTRSADDGYFDIIHILSSNPSVPGRMQPNQNGFLLHSTPLSLTAMASFEVVKQFKQRYKNDIVNVVYLTDGRDDIIDIIVPCSATSYAQELIFKDGCPTGSIVHIVHPQTKVCRTRETNLTETLLSLLGEVEGVNHVGFFLCSDKRSLDTITKQRGLSSKCVAEARSRGWIELNECGFNSYYLINLGFSTTEDVIGESDTTGQISKKFMRGLQNNRATRTILANFAKQIAI